MSGDPGVVVSAPGGTPSVVLHLPGGAAPSLLLLPWEGDGHSEGQGGHAATLLSSLEAENHHFWLVLAFKSDEFWSEEGFIRLSEGQGGCTHLSSA